MNEDSEALKQEALAWIVRLTSGKATTDDGDALMRWRARSSAHEEAFREASRLWQNIGPALSSYAEGPRGVVNRRAFLTGSATVCASATAVCFGLSQLGILPTLDALIADYSTAVGEQKSVTLPDGSIASLDGATTISIDFTTETRNLALTGGAAVFEVVENDRPFTISAKAGTSITQRASVSVKHGVDDVSVDCMDGKVQVDCLGKADLATGEGITYSASGIGERVVSDAETAAAWRKGLLIFRNRPLADVVSDLNRHRRGKVMIAKSSLRSLRVSGVFHLDRPEEILAQLEDTMNVRPINLVGGVVLLQ